MEHRLSVIENPKPHGKSYNKWLCGNAKPCQRDLLRAAIDAALAKKPENFEVFLKLVEEAGYTVKRGKHVTFSCNTYTGTSSLTSFLIDLFP